MHASEGAVKVRSAAQVGGHRHTDERVEDFSLLWRPVMRERGGNGIGRVRLRTQDFPKRVHTSHSHGSRTRYKDTTRDNTHTASSALGPGAREDPLALRPLARDAPWRRAGFLAVPACGVATLQVGRERLSSRPKAVKRRGPDAPPRRPRCAFAAVSYAVKVMMHCGMVRTMLRR